MKKIVLILVILLLPIPVVAFEASATSAILMDMDSGRILYSKNLNMVRSVASISKIMTAIIAIESDKLDDMVIVSDIISKSYGSNLYLKKGEEIKLNDLVYGLMLRSGNDAAYVISEYVGGNETHFVSMMNEKAKYLNMMNTVFNNPNGLDEEEGNYSTVLDMAKLTSYAMKNEKYREVVKTRKYSVKTNMNTYIWHNKNKLLNLYNYTTGGKTGYTVKAKRTLVTTALKDGLNLVVVTLNDGNDFLDHINLYKEAYEEYSNYKILVSGEIDVIGDTYYQDDTLYINNSFIYPLSEGEKENVLIKYNLDVINNYQDNDKVGDVRVLFNDDVIYKDSIYIKKGKKGSFLEIIKRWLFNDK